MYIHVGKPNEEFSKKFGNEARIQLNDKFADVKDIKPFVAAERAARREELVPKLITSLKVDKDANMGIIGDIKKSFKRRKTLLKLIMVLNKEKFKVIG